MQTQQQSMNLQQKHKREVKAKRKWQWLDHIKVFNLISKILSSNQQGVGIKMLLATVRVIEL